MTDREFEQLLYRRESESLDFKRQAYPIQGASDFEKAELIKDVLAFANAWRDGPAYIVLGVAETKDGPLEIVGIPPESHIDDAVLQQLVNAKLNRPIRLSYERLTHQEKSVGVITIGHPLARPVYLRKAFGGLAERAVFIRRGSSTATADPDEIARMGVAAATTAREPRLLLEFADPALRRRFGESTLATVQRVCMPVVGTPEYASVVAETERRRLDPLASLLAPKRPTVEDDYEQVRQQHRQCRLGFWLANKGAISARDVRAVFHIQRGAGLEVMTSSGPATGVVVRRQPFGSGVGLETTNAGWEVAVTATKLQAGQEVFVGENVVIAADRNCDFSLPVRLYADELSAPQEATLRLVVKCNASVFRYGKAQPSGAR